MVIGPPKQGAVKSGKETKPVKAAPPDIVVPQERRKK
jgi:hypothetical protein